MSNFRQKSFLILGAIFVLQLLFPQYSYAYDQNYLNLNDPAGSILAVASFSQPLIVDRFNLIQEGRLPQSQNRQPRKTIWVTVTAYSSTVDQCDDSPFITANGSWVRDGIVAANFLPFGAKIKLPAVAGDKVFSVEDRMNIKYNYRLDIWMPTREEAKKFGVQYVKAEIY